MNFDIVNLNSEFNSEFWILMITGIIKPSGSDIEAILCISDRFVKIFVKFFVQFSKSKIKV